MALSVLVFLLSAGFSDCFATAQSTPEKTDRAGSELLVIPKPKNLQRGSGAFAWKRDSRWRLAGPERDARLWKSAGALFGSAKGKFVTHRDGGYWLSIGRAREEAFPKGTNQPTWYTNPEGYRILVTPKGILLQSSTAQGAFYGLQTLGQLVEDTGTRLSCPAVEITDWPSLRFRGVHWFPSASGVPMYSQLIDNVFSTLKFNHCVIECEAARWDSHPEIAMTNSISKADLRMLVDKCRARFIEPIPLVNVPGHAGWVFEHDSNLDLAEDREAKYAVCVKNPKTIQLVEAVMTEAIDVFHPKTFHIGHDEIDMRGHFPNPECPYCKGESATTLITESANRLADWLAGRGITTMMWGDMLLAKGEADNAANAKNVPEARQRREAISKKIIIADWRYWNADRHSLDIFHQAGFHTIASTFLQQNNIFHFSHAAIDTGSDGLLQTTWDGFFPDERAMKSAMDQFTAYVLAADYAWSGRDEPPSKLDYDARKIFLKAYAGKFAKPEVNHKD